ALYVSGSLNESRQALVVNAENIDVHCSWQGEVEMQRTREAQQEFDLLWTNSHPHFQVLSLPEAVQRKLVDLAGEVHRPTEIDGTSAAPLDIAAPSPTERLQFAMLADGPYLLHGRYVGMETAPVKPWPHQAVVARRILSTYPFSYLMCDEVGLGKTIEAGLIIRSLVLSGIAPRVLIAAPASLTRQWLREMSGKFLLPFSLLYGGQNPRKESIYPHQKTLPAGSLFEEDLSIISTGLLVRKEPVRQLKQCPGFDLTLVDEAHYARRKDPNRGVQAEPRYGSLYRLISRNLRPATDCLLLATATPMQLDPVEVFDLISLTNRVSSFQHDPGLFIWYFSILSRIVNDHEPESEEWEFLRQCLEDIQGHDPMYMDFLQKAVLDTRVRSSYRRFRERGVVPRGRDLKRMQRLFFAASPLSRVMLRHTRSLLEIYKEKGELQDNLAKRHILPLQRITYTENERHCYIRLEEYCRRLAGCIKNQGDRANRASIGFYLSFLRLRFASSFYALSQTLQRRLERIMATLKAQEEPLDEYRASETELQDLLEAGDEDQQLVQSVLRNRTVDDLQWEQGFVREMIDDFERLPPLSSKMKALLGILEQRSIQQSGRYAQTVIFTRFFDTLTDIVNTLVRQKPGILVGMYSGQGARYMNPRTRRLVGTDRETVKHLFLHQDIDILVCTDAAAEGLNLQTADLLVNYDLPWNPMKVEQRIGRIDRIGQENESVQVINLCYADSAEALVYGRLLERLSSVDSIVGSQQLSLLPVGQEDFQELIDGKIDQQALETRVRKRLEETRSRIASREIPARELYEIYANLEQSGLTPESPVNMDTIWSILSGSRTLQACGCEVDGSAGHKTIILRNIEGVPEETLLTSSRKTFEYGSSPDNAGLHFAGYGDPVFHKVLQRVCSWELPDCLHRIQVHSPGGKASLVGYAVAVKNDPDQTGCTLVLRPDDLENLDIDENATLSREQIKAMEVRLQEMAREEFSYLVRGAFLEKENIKAALSQQMLNYLIIRFLINFEQKMGMAENLFWDEVKKLQARFQEKHSIQIILSREKVSSLTGLLFMPQEYVSGDKALLNAPAGLLFTALDAVCRLANSMHRSRAELETEQVLARMEREMEMLEKQIKKLDL
ncbi:helicase-related protein, partial [Desulfonatronospira sp.]|uniref:helicase-related protein n=1 Tax=Desulfonatronospira sp. TaxID=1962951 RepID=UPI0025B8E42B